MVNYSLNKTSVFLKVTLNKDSLKKNCWSNALMQSMILALMHNILAKRVNEHYNGEVWRDISITKEVIPSESTGKKKKNKRTSISEFI